MPTVLGLQDKINLRNLNSNPGIIPLKLGSAKLEKYSHSLIYFYDLNPLGNEIQKLNKKSFQIVELINKNRNYSYETSNYLKILKLVKETTETKLSEIIPRPMRPKRGLINGVGSIFKAITGNLDASDGERYEALIRQLQINQEKLSSSIVTQNSISLELITKFNNTIEKVSHNEKLLEDRLNQIAKMVENNLFNEDILFIKDVLIQLITLYEYITSILQDIENSITFAKIKILHPSIIKTTDLYRELVILQKYLKKQNNLPFPVTSENIPFFEKLIQIDCYVLNNKITYILHIPIMDPESFDYYHLHSIPFLSQNQFGTIIPKNKFLLKNNLHYIFQNEPCLETRANSFICPKNNNKNSIKEDAPCEVQILQGKGTNKCKQVGLTLSKPVIEHLENTNEWIIVLPEKQTVVLKCKNEEFRKLSGIFLIKLPKNCTIQIEELIIINDQTSSNNYQPIIFPDFKIDSPVNFNKIANFELEELNLQDLQEIKTRLIQNYPILENDKITSFPSAWTILIYILLVITIIYWIYQKFFIRWYRSRKPAPTLEEIQLQEVQLPR